MTWGAVGRGAAAVAVWQGGRIEALALAPGIPGLDEQEKRDRVAAGTYQRLADSGHLRLATGLRVQPPAQLWEHVISEWGAPGLVVCDRFRIMELVDAVGNQVRMEPRISRWSDAAFDIRALRTTL